jgi:hypothetical protein
MDAGRVSSGDMGLLSGKGESGEGTLPILLVLSTMSNIFLQPLCATNDEAGVFYKMDSRRLVARL